jgi:hypothetical protein
VSSALASALAVLEVSKDPRVREALGRVREVSNRLAPKVEVAPPKGVGPGRYILVGVALVAAAGVAYAAWQTLRADDELWVSDEETDEIIVSAGKPETATPTTPDDSTAS